MKIIMLAETLNISIGWIVGGAFFIFVWIMFFIVTLTSRFLNKRDERSCLRRQLRREEDAAIDAEMKAFQQEQEIIIMRDKEATKQLIAAQEKNEERKKREELKKLFPGRWLSGYEKCQQITNKTMRQVWFDEWTSRYRPGFKLSIPAVDQFASILCCRDGTKWKETLEKFRLYLDIEDIYDDKICIHGKPVRTDCPKCSELTTKYNQAICFHYWKYARLQERGNYRICSNCGLAQTKKEAEQTAEQWRKDKTFVS